MLLQSVAVSSLALVSQGNVEHRSSEIENFHSHDFFFWGGEDLSLEEFGQLVHISSSYDQKLSCFRDTVHVPESCVYRREIISLSTLHSLHFHGFFSGPLTVK